MKFAGAGDKSLMDSYTRPDWLRSVLLTIDVQRDFTIPGAEGSQIVNELLPSPSIRLDTESLLRGELPPVGDPEWIIYKPRWGAFYRTRLEERLQELGVNTIVFSGCNFPNCPRTALELPLSSGDPYQRLL